MNPSKMDALNTSKMDALRALPAKSLCHCGCTGDGPRSGHAGPNGHGQCLDADCPCLKFTWSKFTPAAEAILNAQILGLTEMLEAVDKQQEGS